jgi:hypothetical protein
MPIVSTGQITIVDNNDAKPITGYITANPGAQQIYSKDESTVSYSPDWTTVNGNTGMVLTAKVFVGGVGGAQEITGQMTNRRWSTDLATALSGTGAAISGAATLNAIFVATGGTFTVVHSGSASTLTLKANIMDTVSQAVIYFDGDYTDPATSLTSRIVLQIQLGRVSTGTNAVYVITRGTTAIEQATGSTKNVAVVTADLMRAAGHDTTGITYRFYENNGATHIWNTSPFTTKYGYKTIGSGAAPTGSASDINTNLPTNLGWSSHNTLVIHESAVNDMGVYRVEAKDADGVIFQTYFTIYDVSDPYEVRVNSTSGDKLQNGVGSTSLTPDVFYGAARVSSLTGWTFTWTLYNKDGKRGGLVDTTRTAVAGGRDITNHTTGSAATITYNGANITMAAGDLIKCVTASGADFYYEVASNTSNVATIRTPSTNTWLNFTDFPAPVASQFLSGGKLFVIRNTQGQATTSAAAALVLTGDDVDIKSRIVVDANRP